MYAIRSYYDFSQTYNMSSKQWSNGWGISAGVGIGNDASGIGFNVGYGSSGWTYGMGGYYNSHAWDSNPVYAPDEWNDGLNRITSYNVCYTKLLRFFTNPLGALRRFVPSCLTMNLYPID